MTKRRRLYVFVDESGNHSRSDCYTVAACWCVTGRDDPTEILKSTKRKIVSKYLGTGQELKGEKIADVLEEVFYSLPSILREDDSINLYNLPWSNTRSNGEAAVGYTIYESEGDLGLSITRDHLGESGSGTTPQLIALASVISPLLRIEGPEHARIDRRHVILDDTTWEQPRHKLSSFVGSIDWSPEISFETRKSHAAPGIQLADIAAYYRRRCLIEDEEYYPLSRLLI